MKRYLNKSYVEQCVRMVLHQTAAFRLFVAQITGRNGNQNVAGVEFVAQVFHRFQAIETAAVHVDSVGNPA